MLHRNTWYRTQMACEIILEPFASIPEQQEHDYLFSTAPFPNPEEKGALVKAIPYSCK